MWVRVTNSHSAQQFLRESVPFGTKLPVIRFAHHVLPAITTEELYAVAEYYDALNSNPHWERFTHYKEDDCKQE